MAGHISYPRAAAIAEAWSAFRDAVRLARIGNVDLAIRELRDILSNPDAPLALRQEAEELLRRLLAVQEDNWRRQFDAQSSMTPEDIRSPPSERRLTSWEAGSPTTNSAGWTSVSMEGANATQETRSTVTPHLNRHHSAADTGTAPSTILPLTGAHIPAERRWETAPDKATGSIPTPLSDKIKAQRDAEFAHVIAPDFSKGRLQGLHHIEGTHTLSKGRVIDILNGPDASGVYEAIVEALNESTGKVEMKMSTMFPDHLTRKEVYEAIQHAYNHRYSEGKQFIGPSGRGFDVLIIPGRTAYPVFRDKNSR